MFNEFWIIFINYILMTHPFIETIKMFYNSLYKCDFNSFTIFIGHCFLKKRLNESGFGETNHCVNLQVFLFLIWPLMSNCRRTGPITALFSLVHHWIICQGLEILCKKHTKLQHFPKWSGFSKIVLRIGFMERGNTILQKEFECNKGASGSINSLIFRILRMKDSGFSLTWTIENPRARLVDLSQVWKAYSLTIKSL